jgi:hypothetical protein
MCVDQGYRHMNLSLSPSLNLTVGVTGGNNVDIHTLVNIEDGDGVYRGVGGKDGRIVEFETDLCEVVSKTRFVAVPEGIGIGSDSDSVMDAKIDTLSLTRKYFPKIVARMTGGGGSTEDGEEEDDDDAMEGANLCIGKWKFWDFDGASSLGGGKVEEVGEEVAAKSDANKDDLWEDEEDS